VYIDVSLSLSIAPSHCSRCIIDIIYLAKSTFTNKRSVRRPSERRRATHGRPEPRPALLVPIGHPTRPHVHLQRRVEQPRRTKLRVAPLAERDERLGGRAVFRMRVERALLAHGRARARWPQRGRGRGRRGGRRVVVPDVEEVVVREGEQASERPPERVGVAAGKVGAGGANVRLDEV
jgi:hypothetical protein